MPAQILHTLFGEDLLTRLATPYAKTVLKDHHREFALGCQGPDLFYHSQHRRPVALEYGTLLHRRGYGSFEVALFEGASLEAGARAEPWSGAAPKVQAVQLKPTAFSAYALGFATHAFLDRAAHPFIVCKAGWVSPAKPETLRYARAHAFFERVLDVLMLDRLRHQTASAWDQESILSTVCDKPPEGLPALIGTSLIKAFPKRAGKDEKLKARIDNAFADAASFYRYTNPVRTSLKHWHPDSASHFASSQGRSTLALIYPEELPSKIDYLNLDSKSWPHPCAEGKLDARSFPELYEGALDTALPLMSKLLKYLSASNHATIDFDFLSEGIGNQGLSVLDIHGLSCAPVQSDPLPLDVVLDAQYTLRMAYLEQGLD